MRSGLFERILMDINWARIFEWMYEILKYCMKGYKGTSIHVYLYRKWIARFAGACFIMENCRGWTSCFHLFRYALENVNVDSNSESEAQSNWSLKLSLDSKHITHTLIGIFPLYLVKLKANNIGDKMLCILMFQPMPGDDPTAWSPLWFRIGGWRAGAKARGPSPSSWLLWLEEGPVEDIQGGRPLTQRLNRNIHSGLVTKFEPVF